jgi:hypothetical protein
VAHWGRKFQFEKLQDKQHADMKCHANKKLEVESVAEREKNLVLKVDRGQDAFLNSSGNRDHCCPTLSQGLTVLALVALLA